MEKETLKEKTAKGLFWGALNNGTMQLLNIVIGILLARLLTATDYGLMGMLAVFTAIAGHRHIKTICFSNTYNYTTTQNEWFVRKITQHPQI